MMLNRLKRLLNITDATRDALLNDVLDGISQAMRNRFLGGAEVPTELEHVVIDVAAARFNRISSEGMTSNSQEGESLSFIDDDFAPYMDEINGFLRSTSDETYKYSKVRFL